MEAKTSGMGHILPGTILYLPPCSIIPKQSIIYRNRGQLFRWFGHPVLIMNFDESTGIAEFIPVVQLRGNTAAIARFHAPRLAWHNYLLINEGWSERDFQALQQDEDARYFENVFLDRHSFRTKTKHWLVTAPESIWWIEAKVLQPYPQASPKQTPCSLPNPRYCLSNESLTRVRHQIRYYASHPLCTEPPSSADYRPVSTAPKVGFVYRLPLESKNAYLNTAQGFSSPEKPLGRPILVTQVEGIWLGAHSEGPKPAVRGFMITSFKNGSIDGHAWYMNNLDTIRWVRSQYLPIEGPDVEKHERLPVVTLAENSSRFSEIRYVHVQKHLRVEVDELQEWTAPNYPEVHFSPETVRGLLEWHYALRRRNRELGFYEDKRRVLEQQGLAGLVAAQNQIEGEAGAPAGLDGAESD